MKSKLKVMTIVGTRPEIIKLARVIPELDLHTDHILVHTGQNYDHELNQIFFKEMRLRAPNHVLNVAGKTVAETIGNVISQSDQILEKENPDALLIYGDTNSCLAVISAKRRKIPIFHMEAGNRCFDQRVPEELNRKIVDHLSDINLPLTEHARQYLLNEGLNPETIIKSGSTMKEVIDHYRNDISASNVLKDLSILAKNYLLVSLHREENVDSAERLGKIITQIGQLAIDLRKKVIFSTHPRTRKRIEDGGVKDVSGQISFIKPLGFFDYVRLQESAYCVISDSGTISEESSLLGFPAVMIRDAHERPEGMDEGAVVMSASHCDRLYECVKLVTSQVFDHGLRLSPVNDYLADHVSKKVVRIILSYTDYVNRTVWHK